MTTILFKNLLQSAGDFMDNETFSQRIRLFVQHLPPFFELLWCYKHIILRDTRSDSPEAISSDGPVLMFPVVQMLVVSYCNTYESTMYVMRLYLGICELTVIRTP